MLTRKLLLPLTLFLLASLSYTIFSYGLTAPNLILSTWQPYWLFQTWMWETFFNNRSLLTWCYSVIVSTLCVSYGWLIFSAHSNASQISSESIKHKICLVMLLSTPFLFASSALSYDVFNYIFNAKMITFYQANPHVSVALDFPDDLWIRFMHNTHTPAPYGYGWTVLSLLPFSLGFGKLLITWFNFKIFSWLSYILLGGLYTWQLKNNWWKSLLILANPLVLLEIIGDSHNDLWMTVPALAGMLLISNLKNANLKTVTLATTLLIISISIKLATILLVPLFIVLLLFKTKYSFTKNINLLLKLVSENWPILASIALFIPLFLERSKWFLPWYITWSLVWIPLISFKNYPKYNWLKKLWISLVIGFSTSSLVRYLPFLLSGNYFDKVETQQVIITWAGGVIIGLLLFLASLKVKHAR